MKRFGTAECCAASPVHPQQLTFDNIVYEKVAEKTEEEIAAGRAKLLELLKAKKVCSSCR